MKLIFCGTGTSQGVPVIGCNCGVCSSADIRDKRLRSSVVIQSEQTSFIIDTGPDFRQQMLRYQVKSLDAIVYTHQHKDHTAGLDDIRAYNYRQSQAIPIYANRATLEHLKREYYYIFESPDYPGLPKLGLNQIEKDFFRISEIGIQPISIMHGRLPILGFRIGKLAYITDASFISEESIDLLQDLDILVINALRKEKHHSHFTLSEALDVIKRLQVKKAYLTHISHLLGKHQEIQAELPEGVFLAYDGLTLHWD